MNQKTVSAETPIARRAVATLVDLWQQRLVLSPQAPAYQEFDKHDKRWKKYSWQEADAWVGRYKKVFSNCRAQQGERIAVMLGNGLHWISCDQAILSHGCVSVPIFSGDNLGNCDYILRNSDACILVTGRQQLTKLRPIIQQLPQLKLVCVDKLEEHESDEQIKDVDGWIASAQPQSPPPAAVKLSSEHLATIVYTSGTTGPPKGVMLSHDNIISNVFATWQSFPIAEGMLYISFLPLSHTFERTASYYLAILTGAEIAFARSSTTLMEDIRYHRPNVLMSVPLIYEKIHHGLHARLSKKSAVAQLLFRLALHIGWQKQQRPWLSRLYSPLWYFLDRLIAKPLRAALGGRIRWAVSGGAALAADVTRTFIAFGVPICQGYGLTECSPVVSVNPPWQNVPDSIGFPIAGTEVKIGEQDELLVRSRSVMQAYWKMEQATAAAIDADGWLHTGDCARIDKQGRIFITGRLKEIIVMGNGEKVPPVNLEQAILSDPLFTQAMVWGEGRAFLIALLVVDPELAGTSQPQLKQLPLSDPAWQKEIRKRIKAQTMPFPAYARIRRFLAFDQPWSIENGMLTPTMKIRRQLIYKENEDRINAIYQKYA